MTITNRLTAGSLRYTISDALTLCYSRPQDLLLAMRVAQKPRVKLWGKSRQSNIAPLVGEGCMGLDNAGGRAPDRIWSMALLLRGHSGPNLVDGVPSHRDNPAACRP